MANKGYKYFISFTHKDNETGLWGFGNTIFVAKNEVDWHNELIDITKTIEKESGCKNIVINNFIEL